jgi:hypothetical protein
MPPYRAESVTSGGPRARAMDGSEHDGVCTMYDVAMRGLFIEHPGPGQPEFPARVARLSGILPHAFSHSMPCSAVPFPRL